MNLLIAEVAEDARCTQVTRTLCVLSEASASSALTGFFPWCQMYLDL